MMRNSITVVLYFEKETIFNPNIISTKLNEKIENIGNSINLPINTSVSEDANIPIIIFNQNKNINITANFQQISITLFDNMINKVDDIVKKVFNIFSDDYKFVRIGFIINKILESEYIEKIKNEIKCNNEDIFTYDFKLAWLTELTMNNIKINFWKNYFSDKENTDKILMVLDFNTKAEEKIVVDIDFIFKFLNKCKDNINQ